MNTREKEEYTKGRSGLKIPVLSDEGVWTSAYVLYFLKKLQTVNGFDVSTSQGSREGSQPRSYHNVLMIGKTGTKPLVVIEGSYEARARSDVKYDLRRNREREEWGQRPSTTTGYAKHAVYVSPVLELKESTALLELQDTSTEGGSGYDWNRGPSLYISGERKEASDFFPEPDDYTEINQQLGTVAYSDYLKQTVATVVALLK